MRDDIVGYRPHQISKLLRGSQRRGRQAGRGEPLFPGGNVRELWKLAVSPPRGSPPTAAVGPPPNAASPPLDVALESDPPQARALLPTGQPGTPGAFLTRRKEVEVNQTKEIVAPEPSAQLAVVSIQTPQPEADSTIKMADTFSVTAPDLPEEFEDPGIELPLPIAIAVQERQAEPAGICKANPRSRRKQGDISLSHHAARCSVCHHPDRDAIEQGFLHWESPTALAYEYDLGRRRAVYRHAHALGLFEKRGARTRRSLEFVMEQAETVTATADSVIRAVRAYSCVSDDGRWTEPVKRVIITHEHVDRKASEDTGVPDAVQLPGDLNNAGTVAAQASPAPPPVQSEAPVSAQSATFLGTSHSRLPTVFDGHARPSKKAATPASPTKVKKLMGTLSRAFSAPIGSSFERRFGAKK